MIRFSLRELRKGLLINLIVVLQTSLILTILLSTVTAIRSRYQLYQPIRDYVSENGCICYFEKARTITHDDLQKSLHGDAEVYISYKLFSETAPFDFQVFEDNLLSNYTPACKEGAWTIRSEDTNTIHTVVYESSKYQIGDRVTVQTENGDKEILVTGIMDDSTLVWYYNNHYVIQNDYRVLFADATVFSPKIFFLSSSEAEKLNFMQIASGLSFIKYRSKLTEQDKVENTEVISRFGTHYRVDNETMRKNSLRYIYEQLRVLAPVIFSVAVLLLICLICSGAVFANRQRRTYAIFRMLGLTRSRCLAISALRTGILNLIAVVLVIILLLIKPHISVLDNYMVQIDTVSLIVAGCLFFVNILITVCVSGLVLKSTLYQNWNER